MKKLISTLIIFLFFGLCATLAQNKKLTVTITNIKNTQGKSIRLAVFNSKGNFPNDKSVKEVELKATTSTIKFEVELHFGEYAIAVFHDVNSNEKLDKNMFGVPKEPYGFSQNFKPKFSAPVFNDCKFTFNESNNSLSIDFLK